MIFFSDQMKIALVRYHGRNKPYTTLPEKLNRVRGILPPLGLAYMAAVLENAGYAVEIIDGEAFNMTEDDFRRVMMKKPDIVGITCTTLTYYNTLKAAKICKEIGSVVVLGGPHVNAYPKESVSHDFVDYGIYGEGEYALLELVNALDNGKMTGNIRGLVYKKLGKVCVNEPGIVKSLDELPLPAYHLLPMKKYSSVIGLHPVATMITSRGCPYRCGFCFKNPAAKFHRARNPKNVVDEMEYLIENYKIKEVMFYDDTITLNRGHIAGICKEIIRRDLKIKWESPTRADKVDPELLKLMKKAGCIRLRYGVESGDKNILKIMRKDITIAKIKGAFEWTKKAGIETFAYFMIGYADEDSGTIKKTINLAIDLDPDFVMFTIPVPYPGTHLYELAKERCLVNDDYWKDFTLGRTVGKMPYFVKDSEKWIKIAYRKFYFRPGFIIKKLFSIYSFKMLKKYMVGAMSIYKMR